MKVHSHYDNLKVSRDAPPEVIRAAYKSLAQKYHPDRNGDPQAARILQIINAAYDVLSDPARRTEHDMWLAVQERDAETEQVPPAPPPRPPEPAPPPRPQTPPHHPGFAARVFHATPSWMRWFVGIFVFITVVSQFAENKPASNQAAPSTLANDTSPSPYAPPPVPAPPPYVRPANAPNGLPWPVQASYLDGYAVKAASGHSDITIDNTSNDFDIYAKLIRTGGSAGPNVVRQFFIPAGGSFKLETVSPGLYDLHYKELNDGGTFKTDPIALQEYESDGGIHYQSVRMTLYTVPGGNMRPVRISDADF